MLRHLEEVALVGVHLLEDFDKLHLCLLLRGDFVLELLGSAL